MPTRPYATVSLTEQPQGISVLLDGQPVMTPARRLLALPTAALAEAVAVEWRRQEERVRPETMPLTRLANLVIDQGEAARETLLEEGARYAATDLVCHRAAHPPELAARQAALWDPPLERAAARHGAALLVGVGVRALDQPPQAIAAVRGALAGMDAFELMGAAHAMGLMGSVVLALALAEGGLDAASSFEAAFVDELFQLDRWGEDAEARARLERGRAELGALQAWFDALRPPDRS